MSNSQIKKSKKESKKGFIVLPDDCIYVICTFLDKETKWLGVGVANKYLRNLVGNRFGNECTTCDKRKAEGTRVLRESVESWNKIIKMLKSKENFSKELLKKDYIKQQWVEFKREELLMYGDLVTIWEMFKQKMLMEYENDVTTWNRYIKEEDDEFENDRKGLIDKPLRKVKTNKGETTFACKYCLEKCHRCKSNLIPHAGSKCCGCHNHFCDDVICRWYTFCFYCENTLCFDCAIDVPVQEQPEEDIIYLCKNCNRE